MASIVSVVQGEAGGGKWSRQLCQTISEGHFKSQGPFKVKGHLKSKGHFGLINVI